VGERRGRRRRGSGGIVPIRDGVWRVDVEFPRQPACPRRRRAHVVHGSIEDAEAALAGLLSEPSNHKDTSILRTRVPNEVAKAVKHAASAEQLSPSDWLRLAVDERLRQVDGGRPR
jgi:hypothetical protein